MVARTEAQSLLVVVDEGGGLFRLFPDGTAAEIESEDDLRDFEKILALRSTPGAVDRVQGSRLELIAWTRCTECGGSGTFVGPVVCRREWDDDHGYFDDPLRPFRGESLKYGEFVLDERRCDCDTCEATGLVHQYTGCNVYRFALPALAPGAPAVPLGGVA